MLGDGHVDGWDGEEVVDTQVPAVGEELVKVETWHPIDDAAFKMWEDEVSHHAGNVRCGQVSERTAVEGVARAGLLLVERPACGRHKTGFGDEIGV